MCASVVSTYICVCTYVRLHFYTNNKCHLFLKTMYRENFDLNLHLKYFVYLIGNSTPKRGKKKKQLSVFKHLPFEKSSCSVLKTAYIV